MGQLSFVNYFNAQRMGLKDIQRIIDEKEQRIFANVKDNNLLFKTKERQQKFISLLEMSKGPISRDVSFWYSNYISSVYSFIEHVALLTTPFWFATRDVLPQWNQFCNGFHPEGFDTYRDFWTSKENWIDSFIFTICHFHNNRDNSFFDRNASEENKALKYLYERIRLDYRNPIHHGFATGQNRTGLSLEVPSLQNRTFFNMPPLLREIDSKAYEDTKSLLDLFMKVFEKENSQVLLYLETGWEVPVDCTEFKEYIEQMNMSYFIDEYSRLLEHHDDIVLSQIPEWIL